MTTFTMITTIVALSILVSAVSVALIGLGYWMGRNSAEKPFRSMANPGPAPRDRAPVDEPPGDLFNDAAYGFGDEGVKAVPTMGGRQ